MMMYLLLMIWSCRGFNFRGVTVQVDSYIIREAAIYTFTLDRTIDNESKETDWASELVEAGMNVSITFPSQYHVHSYVCQSITIDESTNLHPSCNVFDTTIVFYHAISAPTHVKNVVVVISNVINPSPAIQTGSFAGTIGEDSALAGGASSVQLEGSSFLSCSATFNGAPGNTTGQSITFHTLSPESMPADAYIQVKFPYSWANDLAAQPLPITNGLAKSCPPSSCTGGIQDGYPIITITDVFGATPQASFTISEMLTPPTAEPIDSLHITSFSSSGQTYDSCTTSISGVSHQTIDNIQVDGDLQVGNIIALTINATIVDSMSTSDFIHIKFVADYDPVFFYDDVRVNGVSKPVEAFSGSFVNFTDAQSHDKASVLSIEVSQFYCPPSSGDAGPFVLSIYTAGYLKMEGLFYVSPAPTTLTNLTLSPAHLPIAASSSYTLSLYSTQTFSTHAILEIEIPQSVGIPSNVEASINSQPITTSVVQLTHTLRLTDLMCPSESINIQIGPLTNPSSTDTVSENITAIVYYNKQLHKVSQGSTLFQAQFQPIDTLRTEIESSSPIVMEAFVTLTFHITCEIKLQAGDIIHINFQNIILLSDNITHHCWINSTLLQTCQLKDNEIDVIVMEEVSGEYDVEVRGVWQNPPSTQPIATFYLATYTSSGNMLENMATSAMLSISQGADFITFVVLHRNSSANSAYASYKFKIEQPSPLLQGLSLLTMIFPSELDVSMAACLNCIFNQQQLTITISSPASTLTVENIRNPPTAKPLQNIRATTTLDFNYVYSQTQQLDQPISNNQPSFLEATSTFLSYQYGQTNSIFLNIPDIGIADELTIIFPLQYDAAGVSCPDQWQCQSINQGLSIDLSSVNGSVALSVEGFINPTADPALPITISTWNSGYLMSTMEIDEWEANCSLPCRTCTEPTHCLSCYDDDNITSQTLYDASSLTCRHECLHTQYEDNGLCLDCAETCLQCIDSSTKCTRCDVGTYLYDSSCTQSCPPLYYPSSTQECQSCVSPCQQCTDEATCTSCVEGFFYYHASCRTTCPFQTTVENSSTHTCDPCAFECQTCDIITTNCTTCSVVRDNGDCVSQCSMGYIYQYECIPNCIQPCDQCIIYATTCTSCIDTYFLFNSSCLDACPLSHYPEDGLCVQCATFTDIIHCLDCSSNSTCNSCDGGYVLYNQTCLQQAPSGFVDVNGVAHECEGECFTCQGTIRTCTSCKTLQLYQFQCVQECPVSHYPFHQECVPCQTPCKTCFNVTQCITCVDGYYKLPNLNQCAAQCDELYYKDDSVNECVQCQSPCLSCYSRSSCGSCDAGYYLHGQQCLLTCPHSFVGNPDTSTCTQCEPPCQKCVDHPDTCVSCIDGLYYLHENASCVSVCPDGYDTSYELQICTNCTGPCVMCDEEECLECMDGWWVWEGRCVDNCASTHYGQAGQCLQCSPQCSSCVNSTFCLSCSPLYLWQVSPLEGICVLNCSQSRPIVGEFTCQPCSDVYCTLCSSLDECFECSNTTILFNAHCLEQCPSEYIYNETTESCQLLPNNSTNHTNQTNDTNQTNTTVVGKVVLEMPLPYFLTIVGVSLSVVCFGLKCCWRGFVWGAFALCWGLLETSAFVIALCSYYLYHEQLLFDEIGYLFLVSIAWLFVVNLVVLLFPIWVLEGDLKYSRWKRDAKCNYSLIFLCQFLTFFNFRAQHLLWSNLPAGPKLDDVLKLRYLSVATCCSLVASACFVAASVLFILNDSEIINLYIDMIIVVGVTAIAGLCAVRRDPHLFEDSIQGMLLHRRSTTFDYFRTSGMKVIEHSQDFLQQSIHTPSSVRQSMVYSERSSPSLNSSMLSSSTHTFSIQDSDYMKRNQQSSFQVHHSQAQNQTDFHLGNQMDMAVLYSSVASSSQSSANEDNHLQNSESQVDNQRIQMQEELSKCKQFFNPLNIDQSESLQKEEIISVLNQQSVQDRISHLFKSSTSSPYSESKENQQIQEQKEVVRNRIQIDKISRLPQHIRQQLPSEQQLDKIVIQKNPNKKKVYFIAIEELQQPIQKKCQQVSEIQSSSIFSNKPENIEIDHSIVQKSILKQNLQVQNFDSRLSFLEKGENSLTVNIGSIINESQKDAINDVNENFFKKDLSKQKIGSSNISYSQQQNMIENIFFFKKIIKMENKNEQFTKNQQTKHKKKQIPKSDVNQRNENISLEQDQKIIDKKWSQHEIKWCEVQRKKEKYEKDEKNVDDGMQQKETKDYRSLLKNRLNQLQKIERKPQKLKNEEFQNKLNEQNLIINEESYLQQSLQEKSQQVQDVSISNKKNHNSESQNDFNSPSKIKSIYKYSLHDPSFFSEQQLKTNPKNIKQQSSFKKETSEGLQEIIEEKIFQYPSQKKRFDIKKEKQFISDFSHQQEVNEELPQIHEFKKEGRDEQMLIQSENVRKNSLFNNDKQPKKTTARIKQLKNRHSQKSKVITVSGKKYKQLQKQARQLEKQIKEGERLREDSGNVQTERKKPAALNSIEKIYLSKAK